MVRYVYIEFPGIVLWTTPSHNFASQWQRAQYYLLTKPVDITTTYHLQNLYHLLTIMPLAGTAPNKY